MEKYYCEHCRLLYDKEQHCDVCGFFANKKINIEVQTQSEGSKTPYPKGPDLTG